MDTQSKHFLLCSVIKSAQAFTRSRRSTKLTARDIHQSLFSLGLRPLYSSLELNGDEVVQVDDVVGGEFVGNNIQRISLSVIPNDVWISTLDSHENFKKRKTNLSIDHKMELPESTREYINRVVQKGEVHAIPPREGDVFIACWFMGLHFSNAILSQKVDWKFVRQSLKFLDSVCRGNKVVVMQLIHPWKDGLERIVRDPMTAVATDSPGQVQLIKKACELFLD
jgi:hypothetical protein